MNKWHLYLDPNKVNAQLVHALSEKVSRSDLLLLRSLRLVGFTPDSVSISIPDSSIAENLKQRRLDERILEFLNQEFPYQEPCKLNWVVSTASSEEIRSANPDTISVQPVQNESSNLDPTKTFDSFVMGGSNRFAYENARAVAEAPGVWRNPFFIYGGVGLGKTHLLYAIGSEVKRRDPDKVVRYVTCEGMLNEYVSAIQAKKFAEFRRIRDVDVLLVDDIQFLSRKESFQDEFYNSFNDLHAKQKQIVLASDRTPQQIEGLNDRLLSRFKGGLIADIKLPDLETRMAIIKNLAQQQRVQISNDAIEYLASMVSSNVREIYGAVFSIFSQASFEHCEPSIDLIQKWLPSILGNRPRLTVEIIQAEVAKSFDLDVSELLSDSRNQSVAYPRQIAMFLVREFTNKTLQQIGAIFGRKDHGTVIHAMTKIQKLINSDEREAARIEEIRQRLESEFER